MNEKIGLLFAKYCDVKDLQPPHYNALSREGLEKLLADESFPLEAVVKPANAFIEAAKDAIDKAHTVALAFAVLRGDKVWNNGYYEAWQNAHIKFQEELKRLSV